MRVQITDCIYALTIGLDRELNGSPSGSAGFTLPLTHYRHRDIKLSVINMNRHTQLELLIMEIRKRGALVDGLAGAARRVAVGCAYPRLFLELLEHHSFKAFDAGGVRIHSNLRGEEENLEELLSDKILTQALCEAGFSPFGRPSTGNYDRICFDMRRGGRLADAPVVVMDHEFILSHNRIPKARPLTVGLMQLFEVAKTK
jgi:hypothetical protein